jgi:hypothetical protein
VRDIDEPTAKEANIRELAEGGNIGRVESPVSRLPLNGDLLAN